ncbi:DUF5367 family protein [Salinigranum sp. GCM10025319]|uniref:DUF5367 family protein n=1 Tax=Salinigranum sp. GCM10025319 TaxID=3252687 RepID=UPI00361483A0
MVLDAVAVTAFETVFPNMSPSAGSMFGGLLLLAYASVLLTGVVPLTYVQERTADPADPSSGTEVEVEGDGDAPGEG